MSQYQAEILWTRGEAVFTDNRRAKEVYERQGWRPELETWYKPLS